MSCFVVAKSLLAAGKMEFGSTVLTVVAPPGEYSSDVGDDSGIGPPEAVRVTSIPRTMSLQMLRTFLESEKIGGGPIRDIQYRDGDDTAVVCFEHAQGMERQFCVSLFPAAFFSSNLRLPICFFLYVTP